jgi:RNA polymerase sigma factor (TIGR02999 family)
LVGTSDEPRWDSRGHFFAAAAEAMRRILVENARRKNRTRHGGDRERVELDEADLVTTASPDQLLALDEALARLAADDPEAAELVNLRYFAGLSVEEAAQSLGISRANAYRHWTFARAWLVAEVSGGL